MKPESDSTSQSVSADRPSRGLRRWLRLLLGLVPAVVIVWLAGDFVYSRVVARAVANWEQTVERNEAGVQRGHAEYTVGEGSTALLLVHGINFSPYVYRNLAPHLAERGFTCRVMRLPGFATPIPTYAQSRPEEWVAAVRQELESLRKNHPRVIVVAHSLGGAVTLRTLLQHQPQIAGVVLITPAVEVSAARSPLGVPPRFWHEFADHTLFFTQIAWSPFQYDLADPDARAAAPQQPFTPRTIVDGTFALIDANRGRARELKYPLLLVVSPQDRIVDTPAAIDYFDAWGSTHKTLFRAERAAHMVPLDYGWQEVVAAIATFVEGLPSSDQPAPPNSASPSHAGA